MENLFIKALEEIVKTLENTIEEYYDSKEEDYYPHPLKISNNCYSHLFELMKERIYKNITFGKDIFSDNHHNVYIFKIKELSVRVDLTETECYDSNNEVYSKNFFDSFKIHGNEDLIDSNSLYKIDPLVEVKSYFKSLYEKEIMNSIINKEDFERKRRRM